jgi:streptogramin lyase/mono/diheme cytochrome c family protein
MQFASILKFMLGTFALLMMAVPSQADVLSGYSQITGLVRGSEEGVLPVVEAYNEDLNVAYTVFVVNGHYRAVNLLPGLYRVTIRAAVDQLEGFAPQTTMFDVVADTTVTADFVLQDVGPKLNYAGGMEYADAKIESYDVVFPSGPGRDIFERTCSGCHTAQVFAYNSASRRYPAGRVPKDKAAWGATVDRMHKTPGFGKKGKASLFDPAFLPPADRDILVDYLAEHFPKDGEPRVVQLESEPELDLEALEKAMFIDYIYPDPPEYPEAYPHQVDFDADGNVWVANTKCCMVRFDPRTGDSKAYKGHGGGHGVAVDQTDGTVWYSPDLFKDEVVRRLDPETGLVDHWKVEGDKGLETNTQIFDSKGNLWGSALAPGRLVKWDRATNTIQYWDVPVLRSRPYGIIADHADKIWFADYHNGGVTRFDPDTEVFDHFPVVPDKAAANSMRRPGVDSKNMIWIATWGSRGNDNGALYRLNPDTGDVMERKMGIQYANPYNTEADKDDNIWVASDNYVSMYDQVGDVFTHYPLPVRTDTVKTTISENGGVWFIYRNAGAHAGYNTGAAVLYPDKDKIDTLAAYHPQYAAGYALKNYKGPMAPKVIGGDIISPYGLQNAEEYAAFAKANGLEGYEATSQSAGQKLE